jgi:putative sigma-54 modulation protein
MEFAITTKNMQLTEAIASAVHKRVESLERKSKRFGASVSGNVEVGKTTNHHKKGDVFRAEIHVRLPGKLVYAESTHEDLYAAIGDAKRDAERQVVDYKDKAEAGRKKSEKGA